jgi:hypothetical protein
VAPPNGFIYLAFLLSNPYLVSLAAGLFFRTNLAFLMGVGPEKLIPGMCLPARLHPSAWTATGVLG